MTYLGWRIYYADGSVLDSKTAAWKDASQEGVEVVIRFYEETYRIWHDDHWDVENYCTLLNGGDYYWMTVDGPQNGNAPDVPAGLPQGDLKLGLQIADDAFAAIYNTANNARVF